MFQKTKTNFIKTLYPTIHSSRHLTLYASNFFTIKRSPNFGAFVTPGFIIIGVGILESHRNSYFLNIFAKNTFI